MGFFLYILLVLIKANTLLTDQICIKTIIFIKNIELNNSDKII